MDEVAFADLHNADHRGRLGRCRGLYGHGIQGHLGRIIPPS